MKRTIAKWNTQIHCKAKYLAQCGIQQNVFRKRPKLQLLFSHNIIANTLEELFRSNEWQVLVDILSFCKHQKEKQPNIVVFRIDREASVKSCIQLHKEEDMSLKELDFKIIYTQST